MRSSFPDRRRCAEPRCLKTSLRPPWAQISQRQVSHGGDRRRSSRGDPARQASHDFNAPPERSDEDI
jgi:hypothetical protein